MAEAGRDMQKISFSGRINIGNVTTLFWHAGRIRLRLWRAQHQDEEHGKLSTRASELDQRQVRRASRAAT